MRTISAFVVGVLLTSVVAYYLCSLRTSYIEARFMSAVDAPMRMSLDYILDAFDNNNPALAEARIRLLRSRWNESILSGSLGDIHTDIGNLKLPDR